MERRSRFTDEMVSFVRRLHGLDNDSGDEVPDEYYVGYHTPKKTLKLLTQIIIASDFNAWPDRGGILDQDEELMDDLSKVLALYHRYRPEPKSLGKESEEGSSDSHRTPDYTSYL